MPFTAIGIGLGVAGAATAIGGIIASDNAADAAEASTQASSAAAAANTQLGKDQLQFAKDQYADGAQYRQWAFDTSKQVADKQLQTMDQQNAQAADSYAYQQGTFRPLEQKLVSDAQSYDTAARRADAQQQARTDVEQSFGSAQDATTRAITRTGASVGSGRGMAMLADQQYSKAAAMAGATTQATRNVETQAYARQADAANLGRNLSSNQATQTALGLQAGNSAVGNSTAGLNAATSGTNLVMQGYQGAVSANNSAGQLYGQTANTFANIAGQQNAALSALGSAAGSYLGSYYGKTAATSDENAKTGTGKRLSGMEALAQIEGMDIDKGWRYKPGVEDGGAMPHDGPMAQEVQRTMGDHVAPGGKEIDLVSMQGKLLAGMQALAHKVDRLEKKAPRVKSRGMSTLAEKEAA